MAGGLGDGVWVCFAAHPTIMEEADWFMDLKLSLRLPQEDFDSPLRVELVRLWGVVRLVHYLCYIALFSFDSPSGLSWLKAFVYRTTSSPLSCIFFGIHDCLLRDTSTLSSLCETPVHVRYCTLVLRDHHVSICPSSVILSSQH